MTTAFGLAKSFYAEWAPDFKRLRDAIEEALKKASQRSRNRGLNLAIVAVKKVQPWISVSEEGTAAVKDPQQMSLEIVREIQKVKEKPMEYWSELLDFEAREPEVPSSSD